MLHRLGVLLRLLAARLPRARREPEPVIVVVEPEQYSKALDACRDARWEAMVKIGYFSGLRLGEILALEWNDLDFNKKMIHVRNKSGHKTKSRKNRSIPMFGDIELDVKNASRNFQRILKQAELVDEQGDSLVTMHNLRDTFITNLLETGTDPKTVQILAGHSSVVTTLKYYAGVRVKGFDRCD